MKFPPGSCLPRNVEMFGRLGLWSLLACLLCVSPLVAAEPEVKAAQPADAAEAVKPKRLSVAHVQVKGSLPEGAALPGLFGETMETLDGLMRRLRQAEEDDKLSAVVIHVESLGVGWAKVNELRQAIGRVRKSGKPVYAYLESGMTHDYLVAAACDKVVLPSSGILMLPGVRAEVTFYKNLFDWLQIEPQMLRVGEYKSAAEPYSRSEMSPEFREEMTAVLDSFYEQIVAQIAESRKLPADKVKEAIDVGVMTAAEAKERGLIDVVGYEEEIEALVKNGDANATVRTQKGYGKKKLDTDFSGITGMVKMMNLLMGVEEPQRRSTAPKIAVISAVGPIMSGASSSDLFGESTMGSSTMIKAIRQARDDETVKAIVLRVDSPGGSALASDLMWHELETVQKPFVVSMGDVAASGGYYIAMGSDRIFAEPGTITGSIGVVGGKLAIEKFLAKFGVTTSIVQRGQNSGVLSMTTPFSDNERAAMQKLLNDIYAQFTAKAAAGRKMDVEKLEKLARGRIYTGVQAKEIGLVDEIGTLADAIAYAKKAAGLDPEKKVERLDLPKPTNPFESLFGLQDTETQLSDALLRSLTQRLPTALQGPLRDLAAFEILAHEPALTVLPFRLTVR
jgi:protease IV